MGVPNRGNIASKNHVTVYASLVERLEPSTRGRSQKEQVRMGRRTKVEFATAETQEKALGKLRGRNPGFTVIYYESVEHG